MALSSRANWPAKWHTPMLCENRVWVADPNTRLHRPSCWICRRRLNSDVSMMATQMSGSRICPCTLSMSVVEREGCFVVTAAEALLLLSEGDAAEPEEEEEEEERAEAVEETRLLAMVEKAEGS